MIDVSDTSWQQAHKAKHRSWVLFSIVLAFCDSLIHISDSFTNVWRHNYGRFGPRFGDAR
jgi:hypothetical protein